MDTMWLHKFLYVWVLIITLISAYGFIEVEKSKWEVMYYLMLIAFFGGLFVLWGHYVF